MTSKLQKAHYFGIPSPATARHHHSATDSVEVIVLAAQETGNDDPTAWILSAGNLLFISYCSLLWAYIYCIFTYCLRIWAGISWPGPWSCPRPRPAAARCACRGAWWAPAARSTPPSAPARSCQPGQGTPGYDDVAFYLLNIYNEPSTPGNWIIDVWPLARPRNERESTEQQQ